MKIKLKKISESGASHSPEIAAKFLSGKWFKGMGKTAVEDALKAAAVTASGYATAKGIHTLVKKKQERDMKKLQKEGKPVSQELANPPAEEEEGGGHGHGVQVESILDKIHNSNRKQALKIFNELDDVRSLVSEPVSFIRSDKTKAVAKGLVKGTGKALVGTGKVLTGAGKRILGGPKKRVIQTPQAVHQPQPAVQQPSMQQVFPTADPLYNASMGGGGYRFEADELHYELIGKVILAYFTNLFDVLSQLIESFHVHKSDLSKDPAKLEKIKRVLIKGIMDYKDPLSYEGMLAQLEKIRIEHEVKNEGVIQRKKPFFEAWSLRDIASASGFTVTIMGALAATFLGIIKLKEVITGMKKQKQQLNTMLASNNKLDIIFQGYVIPSLISILEEVLTGKVKTNKLLAIKMHRVLDNLSEKFPPLTSYVKTWYPPVE